MQEKISRKNWTLVWMLGMAGQICWNIENSWFNTFVYAKVAKEPMIITLMVGMSAVMTTLATFIFGTMSDRRAKRRPFIAWGFIAWGLFTFVFGAIEFIPKNSLIALTFAVVALDCVMSMFGSIGYDAGFNSWTTDISNESNRGKLGGALAVMPVLATIFGSVVSGIIVDTLDFFAFFLIMGGFVSLMGILSLFLLKDDPKLKPKRDSGGYIRQLASIFRVKTVRENKELFWVFAVMCVYFMGFNIYFPYITIYFNNYLGMDYTTAGLLQGIGLLAASLCTIPAAMMIDKGKAPLVIVISVIVSFAGLMLITVSSAIPVLLAAIFGAGLGYVLVLQTTTAWIKNLYPDDMRGQFEGVRTVFAVCVPMILGPSLAGVVINLTGVSMEIDGIAGMVPTETLFIVAAGMALLTLLPLIPARKLMKNR